MTHASHDPPIGEIVRGDCLDVMATWPEACVDLVYLDPPFNTGLTRSGTNAHYADRWPTLESYVEYITERIRIVHRILKPTGSILLHCDWRSSHHLRVRLDDVFGADRFVNHLVWTYGLGGSSPRRFARKHDDILFYARGPEYHFEAPLVPATSRRMQGSLKKATDVLDIPAINNMARERTGYPTQKPLALLEILVGACSPADGLVVDPFCGSGTTLVAAAGLGRRYVGIDCSDEAVRIARTRLVPPHTRRASRTAP